MWIWGEVGLVAALVAMGALSEDGDGRVAAPPAVTWSTPVEVATGGGFAGPWRMNESRFEYVDDPTVAFDGRGAVGIAWVENQRRDVFFQVYGPDGAPALPAPVNVSRTPGVFSWLPRVIMSGDDVFVLWQEIVFSPGGSHGGEIFFARSRDGGRTFGRPLNLSNSVAGDGKGRLTREHWDNGSLDLVQAPGGELLAAWTEYQGALWVSRSSDRGERFSTPVHVEGDDRLPARGPSLAAGAGGRVHLAWAVGEDEAAGIRVAMSTDGGRSFSGARHVVEAGGRADAPTIGLDDAGIVYLTYAERDGRGPFGPSVVRTTRQRPGAAMFETPRTISGAQHGASYPAMHVGARGDLYIIWEHHPDPRGPARGLGFSNSGDGGTTFASPALIPGTTDPRSGVNGSRQGKLMRKLAVDQTGRIAVANSAFRAGDASRIWIVTGQVTGGRGD